MEEPTIGSEAEKQAATSAASIKVSKTSLANKSKDNLNGQASSVIASASTLFGSKSMDLAQDNENSIEPSIETAFEHKKESAGVSAKTSRIGSKDNLSGSQQVASKHTNKRSDKLTSNVPHSQSNLMKAQSSNIASKSNIYRVESATLKKPSSLLGSKQELHQTETVPKTQSKKGSIAGSKTSSKPLSRSASGTELKSKPISKDESKPASKTASKSNLKAELLPEASQTPFQGSLSNLSKANSQQSIRSRVDDNDPLIQELREILAQTVEVPSNDEPVGTDAWATDIVQQNNVEEEIEELCWELTRSIIKEAKNDLAMEQRNEVVTEQQATEQSTSQSASSLKATSQHASKAASKLASKPLSAKNSAHESRTASKSNVAEIKQGSRQASTSNNQFEGKSISKPLSKSASQTLGTSKPQSKSISRPPVILN
ncbi:UNVERIFIED_CONTAM: hypothetical protein HDU68_009051 [Siphonaria sp. JEL0065]|nr:hypothetical protein HDU68_009051 [Siphonaria sp. JEL0065]